MTSGPEWEKVERPLLEHLAVLGWDTLIWADRRPSDKVDRSSDRNVILEQRLHSSLLKLNPGPDGEPWLDAARIKSATSEIQSMPAGAKLLEANKRATDLLLRGVTVPGLQGWDGGHDRTINYIDWEDWSANDFLAVSQLPVATPGRAPNIRPDVTLFVNGIPLVVIEAKPPGAESGIADAIDQLRRYANQRRTLTPEGAEQLFWTNQITVATTSERAEAGTFTALPEHYMAWKDPYPSTRDQVAESLHKSADSLTQQELLAAGMLAPERLLDIVRHFTLFMEVAGRTVKIVGRYQQYRGANLAIERLLTGETKASNGEVDRRGGIIWHTQGSGKSLTMVFLIRVMRSHPVLRKFKIVLVTDRTNLQHQLQNTAQLVGETVKVARRVREVRELLQPPGPAVVMVMIQKMRDENRSDGDAEGLAELPVINDSESILVLVDEAHRSHASVMHANLMKTLPNAARIGFTGTPIIMGNRKKTQDIFGSYLDRYTLSDSEADGSTVPIFYEGQTTDAAVKGASRMDEVFYRWFAGLTDSQRETLQQRYAKVGHVLEAPELIEAKARNILRHYVDTVMPGGFKGMVVATSRKACLRYRAALEKARDELVTDLEDYQSSSGNGSGPSQDPEMSFLRNATRKIDLIRRLEFVPVISADHNDTPDFAPWTNKQAQRIHIDSFKLPLGHDEEKKSPLALLIVKSMLLTGFDAPQAQVLYLDRLIQEAELLQAIARVNRTAPEKSHGLVVDYFGVAAQLTKALAAYANADGEIIDPDVEGALRSLTTEIEKLEPRRQRVRQIFVQRGVEPDATEESIEECVQLLGDEQLRAEFDVGLRIFLTTFDIVLPRPEVLPFVNDVNLFGEIQVRVRRRYRDTPDGDFDPYKYKEKIRRLLDDHITVLDLSQKIPPLKITDCEFSQRIKEMGSDRARASEMEHAMRYHFRTHMDEDPAYYRNLSQTVDKILDRLEESWDQIVLELGEKIDEINAGRTDEDGTGLDPTTELPFYSQMAEKLATSEPDASERLIDLTKRLVAEVRRIIGVVGFWDNATKQDELRKAIKRTLDDSDLFSFGSLDELASELVALAKANQCHLR